MTQAWAQAPALGVTQALKDVKLSMTVAGRVDGVLVKEGVNHLNSSLTKVIEKGLRVLPATTSWS